MLPSEPDRNAYLDLRRRMLEQLRDPLLVAIEREFNRVILRENVALSRAEYRRLKWDVVRAIVSGDE